MKPKHEEYKGHDIDLRERNGKTELLVDNRPVRYGRMPNNQYFLHEYAYDWTDDLTKLAQRFIDYRARVEKIRAGKKSTKEGK